MRSFCSAKASLIFSTKNISLFCYKVVKHLTSLPLNELVKLTMLWTTGAWNFSNVSQLTLLHIEWPKLYGVLAVPSATGLSTKNVNSWICKQGRFQRGDILSLPSGSTLLVLWILNMIQLEWNIFWNFAAVNLLSSFWCYHKIWIHVTVT